MGLAWGSLGLAVLVWGLSFPVMKYAVTALGPYDVGLARIALAGLGSLGFLALPGRPGGPSLVTASRLHAGRLVALSALVGYGQTFTFTYGLGLTPATVGSLIPPLNPIATMILAAWLLGEPVETRQWTGLGLAVAGVVLLALRDGWPTWSGLAGPALLAVAPLSWAVYTVVSKAVLRDVAPLHLTTLTLCGGLAAVLPWADPGLPGRLLRASPVEQAAVLFLGLFAMGLAYALWYVGLARIGAGATGATVLGIPLVGVLSAWLLLGERLTPPIMAAGVLIAGGLYLVVGARRGRG